MLLHFYTEPWLLQKEHMFIFWGVDTVLTISGNWTCWIWGKEKAFGAPIFETSAGTQRPFSTKPGCHYKKPTQAIHDAGETLQLAIHLLHGLILLQKMGPISLAGAKHPNQLHPIAHHQWQADFWKTWLASSKKVTTHPGRAHPIYQSPKPPTMRSESQLVAWKGKSCFGVPCSSSVCCFTTWSTSPWKIESCHPAIFFQFFPWLGAFFLGQDTQPPTPIFPAQPITDSHGKIGKPTWASHGGHLDVG